ncbi:hypothetical protein HF325_003721 [Metschnikowia pulcherrima]|uniref:Uncharacterized protein n=1 Tax=Metschnikowia pulcherrima TaxID=27326 RepID=A0A8H7GPC0_9ASCO|nr:hypothetical protein HF325_003721 [Metschnikowia pulcherrima]
MEITLRIVDFRLQIGHSILELHYAISLSARSRSLSLILKLSSWAAVGSEKSYFSRELGDELLECSEILAGRSDSDLLRPKVLDLDHSRFWFAFHRPFPLQLCLCELRQGQELELESRS